MAANLVGVEVEDRLSSALTNLERLVEVWVDLDTTGADYSAMKSLLKQKSSEIQRSGYYIAASSIRLAHIRRSVAIYVQCRRLEPVKPIDGIGTVNRAVIDLVGGLHDKKLAAHSLSSGTRNGGEMPELARLQGIEEDLEIMKILELMSDAYTNFKALSHVLYRIIDCDLEDLLISTETGGESPSLDMLELGVKIRIRLSSEQQGLLDRFLERKISAMTGLNFVITDGHLPPSISSTASRKVPKHLVKHVGQDRDQSSACDNTRSDWTPRLPNTKAVDGELTLLQTEIEELEAANVGLKIDNAHIASENAKLTNDNNLQASSISKLKKESATWKNKLSEESQAYASLLSAYEEDKFDYEKARSEVMKYKELLEEGEEDRKTLMRENSMLAARNAHVETEAAEINQTLTILRNELAKSSNYGEGLAINNSNMEAKLKITTEAFDEAEKNNAAIEKSAKDLKTENARLQAELTRTNVLLSVTIISLESAKEAELRAARYVHFLNTSCAKLRLDYAALDREFDKLQACVLAQTLHDLTAENMRLERDLANANNTLDQIRRQIQSMAPFILPNNAAVHVDDDDSFADYDSLEAEEEFTFGESMHYPNSDKSAGIHAVTGPVNDCWSEAASTSAIFTPAEDDLIDL